LGYSVPLALFLSGLLTVDNESWCVIPKSGHRFSDKIMHQRKKGDPSDRSHPRAYLIVMLDPPRLELYSERNRICVRAFPAKGFGRFTAFFAGAGDKLAALLSDPARLSQKGLPAARVPDRSRIGRALFTTATRDFQTFLVALPLYVAFLQCLIVYLMCDRRLETACCG
jgi:hypothetical protein